VQLFKKFAQRFMFHTVFCAKAAETGISPISAASLFFIKKRGSEMPLL
jgi:hypothetical protein